MSRRYKPTGTDGEDISSALEFFGKALLTFAETGNAAKLKTSVISLRSVAQGIINIAHGEDARTVFGQSAGRGNSDMRGENFARAFQYWLVRAEHPDDVDAAVRAAQKQFTYLPEPNRATVTRYARKYRDEVLDLFDRAEIKGRGKVDTSAIRKHLAAKNHRGRF